MKLARINTALLCAIIAINLFVIGMPLMPAVTFWVKSHTSHTADTLHTKIAQPTTPASTDADHRNRLVIPSMMFEEPIFDGPDMRTLNKGIWRRPQTSTPDHGRNTVIIGHRFTYTNAKANFYYLDKVRLGDEIGIFWQDKTYRYRVSEVKVVPDTALEVESPTATPQLTLYTCTPLWLPKDRLVVIAQLEETEHD